MAEHPSQHYQSDRGLDTHQQFHFRLEYGAPVQFPITLGLGHSPQRSWETGAGVHTPLKFPGRSNHCVSSTPLNSTPRSVTHKHISGQPNWSFFPWYNDRVFFVQNIYFRKRKSHNLCLPGVVGVMQHEIRIPKTSTWEPCHVKTNILVKDTAIVNQTI